MDTKLDSSIERDAAFYRWLKSRQSLDLGTDGSTWRDINGNTVSNSHYLETNGILHGMGGNLDDIISAAMEIDP